jgi:uncharacterized delta-60 repeat protein
MSLSCLRYPLRLPLIFSSLAIFSYRASAGAALTGLRPFLPLGIGLLLAVSVGELHAADGSFDPTFVNGGRTTFAPASNSNVPQAISETSDGHLIIGGICQDVCLARLKSDGNLDTSYGPLHTGTALFGQFTGPPSSLEFDDMILLSDGRAVVAGCGGSPAIFVIRADGSDFDTSVGHNTGFLVGTQGNANVFGCAMRVRKQKDGKLIVLHTGIDNTYGRYVLVTRITADLAGLDPTFGNGGAAKIAFSLKGSTGNADLADALAVQDDDSIVTGGYAPDGNNNLNLELARLLPNGQLDTSFGGNGDGRFHFGATGAVQFSTRIYDIAIAPDGHVVFGGDYSIGPGFVEEMIGQVTKAGVPDARFEGIFLTQAGSDGATGGSPQITRVTATADSVIALAQIPRPTSAADYYFEVTRFDRLGNKVSIFGGGGSSYASFAADDSSDGARGQVLTTKGLVVTGESESTSNVSSFGVARFQYEHIFGDTFQ